MEIEKSYVNNVGVDTIDVDIIDADIIDADIIDVDIIDVDIINVGIWRTMECGVKNNKEFQRLKTYIEFGPR